MKRLLFLLGVLCLFVSFSFGANQKFTLVIDAGHGGHDAGAIGSITKEKHINLNVALAFGRLVEQNCPDVKVIYTRKSDIFIPLQERAGIANRNSADLFISIHTNSLPGGRSAHGFETYTLGMHRAKDNLDVAMRENSVISMEKDYKQRYQGFDPNSSESYIMFEFMQSANMEKSVELAKIIQRTVCNTTGRVNKGVHQAGFLVLRETSMPSCLIELGFITARDEEEFLHSETGVASMARGIYKAFVEYKNKYSDKIVVPYAAPKNQGINMVGHVAPQNIQVQPRQEIKSEAKQVARPKQDAVKAKPEEGIEKAEQGKNNQDGRLVGASIPLFKVQIFALNRTLRPGSEQFKGHKNVESYNESGSMKYTIGSSPDYDEIVKLRRKLLNDFPQAFIVAFKDGERIDVNKALDEYKRNKK